MLSRTFYSVSLEQSSDSISRSFFCIDRTELEQIKNSLEEIFKPFELVTDKETDVTQAC